MDLDELATKTVDELDLLSVELKKEEMKIHAERRAIAEIRARKIVREGLAQKLGVPVDHLTDQEAAIFLEIARRPKEGDVVATPGTAAIAVKGGGE